jgi:organic hydroperoxide reductase OsmC/OhrA
VQLDSVRVRMEADNNDAGFLGLTTADPSYPFNIRAHVYIESPAAAAQLSALHDYAASTCPLTKLVREPATVTILVET